MMFLFSGLKRFSTIIMVELFTFLYFLNCARPKHVLPPAPTPLRYQSPMVRVGVARAKSFDIFSPDTFILFGQNGLKFSGEGGSYHFETIRSDTIPFRYWVLFKTTESTDSVSLITKELHNLGIPSKFFTWGRTFFFPKDTIDAREFAILIGPYGKRDDIPDLPILEGKGVLIEPIGRANALIRVSHQDGRSIGVFRAPLRLLPDPNNPKSFTVLNFHPGVGVNSPGTDTREYLGILEFTADGMGGLYLIVETPAEIYLQGVVPKEMGPQFPLEALKTQAVVARTYLYYNWKKGSAYWKPYDIAGDYSAQAYGGENNRTPKTDSAVILTRGEVLVFNKKFAETLYHACSGGQTEDIRNVFGRDRPYLHGVFCGDEELKKSINGPVKITEWIENPPPVYCSPEVSKISLSKKKFRWTERVSVDEIRKRIKGFKGIDIGKLVEITVLKRGVSGQALKVKITGTWNDVVLKGPYEIRKTLKQGWLKSALFIVDYERGAGGLPSAVILRGGGHGHGVGLCQLGSAGMANLGKDYKTILSHYYPRTQLVDLY